MGKRYLTKKHVIRLAVRKIQNNEPHQLTTTQPFEWKTKAQQNNKKLTISSAKEEAEELELSYIAGRDAKRYTLENSVAAAFHMIQQSPSYILL